MKQLLPSMMFLSLFLVPCVLRGDDVGIEDSLLVEAASVVPARPSLAAAIVAVGNQPIAVKPITDYLAERNAAGFRAWKRSLIPVAVSQSLDVTSSYGMRELNPMLAGPDGRFGAKGTAVKLSAAAALVGVEYLMIKKWPGSARVFSKLNWGSSVLTGAFATHNFMLK